MLKRLSTFIMFLAAIVLFLGVNGQKLSESFKVVAYKDHYKVFSPPNFKINRAIIFENKTLVRLVGKIVNENEKIITFVSIMPGGFKRINVHNSSNDKLRFIPLSPAFQEIKFLGN